jgi:hypothetical protein
MPRPPCEKKEKLLADYIEAVSTHYGIVGQLKAVRHQPKSFSTVLGKAKEAYAEVRRAKSEMERHCKMHGC